MQLPIIDFSGDTLVEELVKPTEIKTILEGVTKEAIEKAAQNATSFASKVTEREPEAEKATEAAKDFTDDEYRDAAENIIMLVDGLSQMALPFIHMRVEFTESERSEIKKNLNAFKKAYRKDIDIPFPENEALQAIYERWCDTRKIIDEIELDEKEMEMLTNPFAKVLKKYKKAPGPESVLIAAVLAVYSQRLTPLTTSFM